jgi:hypothetical protein
LLVIAGPLVCDTCGFDPACETVFGYGNNLLSPKWAHEPGHSMTSGLAICSEFLGGVRLGAGG